MTKSLKQIEIVRSNTRALSSLSQASAEAILAVLSDFYQSVVITSVSNLAELEQLAQRQPDLVFLGVQYVPVDNQPVWVSTFLEDRGILHTGSSEAAINLEHDKSLAKDRLNDEGLATAKHVVVRNGHIPASYKDLSFPLFVKPVALGGGVGIDEDSVVHNIIELTYRVKSVYQRIGCDLLVEEYLDGREFSVAVLRTPNTNSFQAFPIELVAPTAANGVKVLSRAVKSGDAEVVSLVLNPILKAKVCRLALDAFEALGAKDYGRIDIRLDSSGQPHFLEANLIPSLIDNYGSLPKACALNAGISHQSIILQIVELASELRYRLPAAQDMPQPVYV